MSTYETDHKKIDWDNLKGETVQKIEMLHLAWIASQSQAPELHQKLVDELYVPMIRLLAEFSTCIEVSQEHADTDEES